jgi:hypothetical protein
MRPEKERTYMTGNRPSIRWFAGIASFAVILVFGLSGISAAPPAASSVRIVDGANAGLVAKVDAAGNLATTSTDDPGREVYQAEDTQVFGGPGSNLSFDVPEGKRLVITHISAELDHTGATSAVLVANLFDSEGHNSANHFFLYEQYAGRPVFFASEETTIFTDHGFVLATGFSGDQALGSRFTASVSGYLIDCTVAPCN